MLNVATAITLSYAAFGVIALLAVNFLTTVLAKVNERNTARENKLESAIQAIVAPVHSRPTIYIYDMPEAASLSRRIRSGLVRLALAYALLFACSFVMSLCVLSTEPRSTMARGFIQADVWSMLLPPLAFTLLVVVVVWRTGMRYSALMSQSRHGT